jgi:CubicO group peptidase (beta-lactamase class C family)
MKTLFHALAWLSLSSVLFAQKPLTLAASAQKVAKSMPRGCIVTGEWRDGKAVYAISGPDKPANVPAEKVVFEIGSISKVFTGLLLAQAVIEKKLTFETTLKQALDTKQAFADEKVAAITLAQLATHTSGLPRMPDNADFTVADPYAAYDTKKLGDWLAGVKIDKAGPHDQSYSNAGVAILGHVIERALGDSWSNLVRDRITKPLGMHDTMLVPTAEMRQRLAPPFDGKRGTRVDLPGLRTCRWIAQHGGGYDAFWSRFESPGVLAASRGHPARCEASHRGHWLLLFPWR